MTAPARPPVDDPVFAAPWEARAFALVVALHEAGLFDWAEFQALLIEETRAAEAAGRDLPYWRRWAAAAERLVERLGLVDRAALDRLDLPDRRAAAT